MKYLLYSLLLMLDVAIIAMDRPDSMPDYITTAIGLIGSRNFAAYEYVKNLPRSAHMSYVLPGGNTVLHCLVSCKLDPQTHGFEFEKNFITLLIERGADIEARNINGLTPFMMALLHSNFNAAFVLANAGALTNGIFNDSGSTPLHILCADHQYMRGVENALCVDQPNHPRLKLLKKILLPATPLPLKDLIIRKYARDFFYAPCFHALTPEIQVDILCATMQQSWVFDWDRFSILAHNPELLNDLRRKIIHEDTKYDEKINKKDHSGNTPLHLLYNKACAHPRVAIFLVCHGAGRLISNNQEVRPWDAKQSDVSMWPAQRLLQEYLLQPQRLLVEIDKMLKSKQAETK